MKFSSLAFISLSLFIIASCGPGDSKEKKDDSYNPNSVPQYCENGEDDTGSACSTGVHRFATFKELCEAIQNDSLNLNCAETKRRRFFADFCDGTFTRDTTPRNPPPFETCPDVVVGRRLTPVYQ